MNNESMFVMATGKQVQRYVLNENEVYSLKANNLVSAYLLQNKDQEIDNLNWKDRKKRYEKKFNELKYFIIELEKYNIDYLHIKGLSFKKYYPNAIPRDSTDYDFCIKSISDYWICHKILIDLGYHLNYHPMLTKKDNRTFGLVSYEKIIDEKTFILIEINIAGFIIAEVTWLDFNEIWCTRKEISFMGMKINIPCDSHNLAILIIELSGKHSFKVRDAVDYYFLRKNGDIKWSDFNIIVQDLYLHKVHLKLLKYTKNLKSSSIRDYSLIIHHILPYIIKEKNNYKKLYYVILKKIGEYFYKKEYGLSFIKYFDYIMSPKSKYHNGIVTSFILLDEKIRGEWKWLKYKKFHLIITPIGIFWASNFALLTEEENESLVKYINSLK